jgi:hypothetical protein
MRTLVVITLLILGACGPRDVLAPSFLVMEPEPSVCLEWGWRYVEGLPFPIPVCLLWGQPESRPIPWYLDPIPRSRSFDFSSRGSDIRSPQ